jgi:hypothetical protein
MKKILTGLALAATLPVYADSAPTAPAPMMNVPQAPVKGTQMQMPQMQMPQMHAPNMGMSNRGSNWNMPNMNWANGYNNGSNMRMPNMNWGRGGNMPNMNLPNMNMPNMGNGSRWNMPNMGWGNNPANRATAMPNMNWGNGTNGNNWNMPRMNWGNNNSGWNVPRWGGQGTTMYMPVPVAPQSPHMMRPSAPQGVHMMTMPSAPTTAIVQPVGHAQKAAEPAAKSEKVLSASDIVKQKIEEMQTLNKAIANKLLGADKKEATAETPKAVVTPAAAQPQKAEEPTKEEKTSSAGDLVKQQVGEMKKLAGAIEKKILGEKAEEGKVKEPEAATKE